MQSDGFRNGFLFICKVSDFLMLVSTGLTENTKPEDDVDSRTIEKGPGAAEDMVI